MNYVTMGVACGLADLGFSVVQMNDTCRYWEGKVKVQSQFVCVKGIADSLTCRLYRKHRGSSGKGLTQGR